MKEVMSKNMYLKTEKEILNEIEQIDTIEFIEDEKPEINEEIISVTIKVNSRSIRKALIYTIEYMNQKSKINSQNASISFKTKAIMK